MSTIPKTSLLLIVLIKGRPMNFRDIMNVSKT